VQCNETQHLIKSSKEPQGTPENDLGGGVTSGREKTIRMSLITGCIYSKGANKGKRKEGGGGGKKRYKVIFD